MNENINLISISEIKDDYSNIDIKTYLPFAVKKTLIKTILEASKTIENNITKIDYSNLEMAKEYVLVNNYTNINLESEEIITIYDNLKQKGIVQYVINQLQQNKELDFYNTVLQEEINQIQTIDNSMTSVISKVLLQLVNKIPNAKEINKMIPKLSKELNKISPETLDLLKSINKQQI